MTEMELVMLLLFVTLAENDGKQSLFRDAIMTVEVQQLQVVSSMELISLIMS